MSALTPPVVWAQRDNLVYLTICLEDCKSPEVNFDSDKLHFKGNGGTNKKDYEISLEFFEKIKADESKFIVRDRGTEFVLYKEESKWWPRLLKENNKYHWLKVDFNKWKDEDDSGAEDDNFNENSYEDMMKSFGGGAPGFGAGGANFNLDGLGDTDEPDDSEEQLPELEEV